MLAGSLHVSAVDDSGLARLRAELEFLGYHLSPVYLRPMCRVRKSTDSQIDGHGLDGISLGVRDSIPGAWMIANGGLNDAHVVGVA